ncbi:MAG: PIG-L family deacetylase, partial [Streptosporangiaceae bacterium]
MAAKLTLMAVHAHPDDESSSTGGVLAKYSAEGIRTVVVTCTNGEFGDAPGQVKPGQDGHDEAAVAKIRLAELRTACDLLGVSDLEVLGYHDSGMPEWDYKDRPDVFGNVPLAKV